MQEMKRESSGWSARARFALVLLALVLPALAGCAAGGKPKMESAEPASSLTSEPAVPPGPVVARFEDGRKGFVITETPRMDAGSRRDFERATAMMHEGDFGPAAELLEKVVEGEPGVTAPFLNLAIAYRQLGRLEEAEEQLKTALSLVPEHPAASNEYGLVLRQTGRFAEARAIYERTLATFPDYHPARRNLGILCDLYLNDLACALEQYEIYSESRPEDEQVKLWVADLRARLGR